jgi:hypothetical protein
MNIIETNIPDINIENIDQSKIELAEKIIKNINPLFDDLQYVKIDEFKFKVNEFNHLKKNVLTNKTEIENLFELYKKKQKIHKLLERIDKLVSLGIVNEGQTKQETIVLLKIIDKLSTNKLNFYLKETIKTISKRFPTK